MRVRLLLTVLFAVAAVFAARTLTADQPTDKVVVNISQASPADGKAMYVNYCASCHGLDGRGRGPVASQLRKPPSDLTVQSRNNHGHFPDSHIAAVLEFGTVVPAHGTSQMPVWGHILANMDKAHPEVTALRINNLSRYIESLQVK